MPVVPMEVTRSDLIEALTVQQGRLAHLDLLFKQQKGTGKFH